MDDAAVSRRDLVRTGGALLSAAILGSLAGCSALDSSDSDENVTSAFDEVLSQSSGVERDLTVGRALARIEEEYGLDPEKLTSLVAFLGGTDEDFSGVVARTGWSESELAAQLHDGEPETRTYGDRTVYELGGTQLAPLGDGRFAFGSPAAVEAVVDVDRGDRDPVGGTVADTYSSAESGYVQVGFEVPEPDSEVSDEEGAMVGAFNVEYGYGSVRATGGGLATSMTLRTDDQDSAGQLQQILDTRMQELRRVVDGTTGPGRGSQACHRGHRDFTAGGQRRRREHREWLGDGRPARSRRLGRSRPVGDALGGRRTRRLTTVRNREPPRGTPLLTGA